MSKEYGNVRTLLQSYKKQFTDLLHKSIEWFLYDSNVALIFLYSVHVPEDTKHKIPYSCFLNSRIIKGLAKVEIHRNFLFLCITLLDEI